MIESSSYGELKIFSGSANPCLSRKTGEYLNHPLDDIVLSRHSDGEIYVRYPQSIRGADVFLIQPTHSPDSNLMELLMMIDAAVLASAKRITAVIPYYGYARGDRKAKPRESIPAKLVADLIAAAGAHRVLLIDLHASQITGFFRKKEVVPDHLYAKPVFINFFRRHFEDLGLAPLSERLVILSPDVGASKMCRSYAEKLDNVPLAIGDKRRIGPDRVELYNIIGEVKGKTVLILDDLIDTGGTVILAAETALNLGAKEIYAAATHPVLSGNSVARLNGSAIKEIFVSDTVPLPTEKRIPKIKVVSIASIIGDSIKRIHLDDSVSEQFE